MKGMGGVYEKGGRFPEDKGILCRLTEYVQAGYERMWNGELAPLQTAVGRRHGRQPGVEDLRGAGDSEDGTASGGGAPPLKGRATRVMTRVLLLRGCRKASRTTHLFKVQQFVDICIDVFEIMATKTIKIMTL